MAMNKKPKTDFKHRYAIAKHHAWAGSVLLAILGALRWFISDTEYPQQDFYFIMALILIITYILIALLYTYRYRSGLSQNEGIIQGKINRNVESRSTVDSSQISSQKEQVKIEKKLAKTENKRLKKITKAQQKEDKKSS
jgi:hypothetical protein